jgi:hypothetical protein
MPTRSVRRISGFVLTPQDLRSPHQWTYSRYVGQVLLSLLSEKTPAPISSSTEKNKREKVFIIPPQKRSGFQTI